MRVCALDLADFRNHEQLALEFAAGTTTIVGRNGRGKTNIVEAVDYLATLSSHRVSGDAPLVRHGQQQATIRATAAKAGREATIEVTVNASGTNRVAVNGAALRRPTDLLGLVQSVLFSPEDLDLVKGDPAARRRYLDVFATQVTPRISAVRADFERALKQRGALLKSAGRRPLSESARGTLAAWDEQYVVHGAALVWERLRCLALLQPWISEHGSMISGDTEPLVAVYSAKWLPDPVSTMDEVVGHLTEAIKQRQDEELLRGTCLVGPHRDDVSLMLSGAPAKGYASHGQSWSIALALRLATFSVLRAADDDPVLILDDVFAELDSQRRQRLLHAIRGTEQTLITAAVEQDVPAELLERVVLLQD